MDKKEYIERGAFLRKCAEAWGHYGVTIKAIEGIADECAAADVVEVVRCKDCVYFQPDFVLTDKGERRPYTEEEKNSDLGMVTCDVGINCGSRCERFDYWGENKFPVWFRENDFCSYGERKE